jgi:rubrerythrin
MATLTTEGALRMALRLEQENFAEYRRAADEAESPALRAMFSFLAGEEEKHIGLIRDKMAETGVSE